MRVGMVVGCFCLKGWMWVFLSLRLFDQCALRVIQLQIHRVSHQGCCTGAEDTECFVVGLSFAGHAR